MRLVTMTLIMGVALTASSQAETKYFGAVDLGSRGTKGSLYKIDVDDPESNPETVFYKTINTKLVSTMKDGMFTAEGMAEAAAAVKQLVEEMDRDAKKLESTSDRYYVTGSSGVAMAKNKEKLVDKVKDVTGIKMDFIDAKLKATTVCFQPCHIADGHIRCTWTSAAAIPRWAVSSAAWIS